MVSGPSKWSHYLYQPWGWFNRCCGTVFQLIGINCDCTPCKFTSNGNQIVPYYNFEFDSADFDEGSACCQEYKRVYKLQNTGCGPLQVCEWEELFVASGCGGNITANLWFYTTDLLSIAPFRSDHWVYRLLWTGSTSGVSPIYQSDVYWDSRSTDAGYPLLDCMADEILLYYLSGGGCVANEVQTLDFSFNPTGGTYRLNIDGNVTSDITYNVNPQAALNAAMGWSAAEGVGVTGFYNTFYTITFSGTLARRTNWPQITVDDNSLTGSPTIIINTTTNGAPFPWPSTLTLVASDV